GRASGGMKAGRVTRPTKFVEPSARTGLPSPRTCRSIGPFFVVSTRMVVWSTVGSSTCWRFAESPLTPPPIPPVTPPEGPPEGAPGPPEAADLTPPQPPGATIPRCAGYGPKWGAALRVKLHTARILAR